MNTDWETSKKPKAPKKIRAKGIRGFLGAISPSKLIYYAAAGDKEVKTYLRSARKYMNYRRATGKEEWRTFYRYLRLQKQIKKGGKRAMTEPQQKDFEELLEQLKQEEETCESCPDRNAPADRCEGCGTHGNIQDLEQLIESMKEGEKGQ